MHEAKTGLKKSKNIATTVELKVFPRYVCTVTKRTGTSKYDNLEALERENRVAFICN